MNGGGRSGGGIGTKEDVTIGTGQEVGTEAKGASFSPTTTTTTTTTKSLMDQKLEKVVSLVMERSRGSVHDDATIENAVNNLLGNPKSRNNSRTSSKSFLQLAQPEHSTTTIQYDNDEYDNLHKEHSIKEKGKRQTEDASILPPPPDADPADPAGPAGAASPNTQNVTKRTDRKRATVQDLLDDGDENGDDNPLEDIRMGRSGAKMMVTFGDGSNPKPEVVEAALLATRRKVQSAIKDARALRRYQKAEFIRARQEYHREKSNTVRGYGAWDTTRADADTGMYFRAMHRADKLSFDLKCGFDIEQLQALFPEEITAYRRWNEMHDAYAESKEKTDASTSDPKGRNKDIDSEDGTGEGDYEGASLVASAGGHLRERAAQFDIRTDRMEKDWYMMFSTIRQESFLQRGRHRHSGGGGKKITGLLQSQVQQERDWNAHRKSRALGRPKSGTWDSQDAATVKFLHWVGFDPRSALPPPNEETANALAFLAYDFMGRIVERAVALRCSRTRRNQSGEVDEDAEEEDHELHDGDQLELCDIEEAMKDPSVGPTPLYSANDDGDPSKLLGAAQLYFGPGFEQRLEMEMEEIVEGSRKRKRVSAEEQETRRKEDALFESLSNRTVPKGDFFPVLQAEMPAVIDKSGDEAGSEDVNV